MTRTHAYGLLDLFTLVKKLLAPLVDPLRAEFAVKATGKPRATATTQPAAVPVREPATPIVTRSAVVDTLRAEAVIGATPPTTPAAPLFVRKKTGRQWRYHTAHADATGPKFRRVAVGKRVRYEPVG